MNAPFHSRLQIGVITFWKFVIVGLFVTCIFPILFFSILFRTVPPLVFFLCQIHLLKIAFQRWWCTFSLLHIIPIHIIISSVYKEHVWKQNDYKNLSKVFSHLRLGIYSIRF